MKDPRKEYLYNKSRQAPEKSNVREDLAFWSQFSIGYKMREIIYKNIHIFNVAKETTTAEIKKK